MTGAAALSSLPGILSRPVALFSGIPDCCFYTKSAVTEGNLNLGTSSVEGSGGV